MNKFILNKKTSVLVSSMTLALCATSATAGNKEDLKALVNAYIAQNASSPVSAAVSTSAIPSIDSLNSAYDAFTAASGLGLTFYTADLSSTGSATSANASVANTVTVNSANNKTATATGDGKIPTTSNVTSPNHDSSKWIKTVSNAQKTWTTAQTTLSDDQASYQAITSSTTPLLALSVNRCSGQTALDPNGKLYDPLRAAITTDIGLTSAQITAFNNAKTAFCKLIHVAANLQARYNKWQDIKENGIVLKSATMGSKKLTVSTTWHKYERHIDAGYTLTYFPLSKVSYDSNGIPAPDLDAKSLAYNSWIKWSSDNPTPLNILKTLRDFKNNSGDNCSGFCIPVIDSVQGKLCTKIDASNNDKLNISNCVQARFEGSTKTATFPSYEIPAPFGYLAEVETMKDQAMVNLQNNIKNKIMTMINLNSQMLAVLCVMQSNGDSAALSTCAASYAATSGKNNKPATRSEPAAYVTPSTANSLPTTTTNTLPTSPTAAYAPSTTVSQNIFTSSNFLQPVMLRSRDLRP